MPEMPEVETIRRGLTKYIVGKKLVQADVLLPRQLRAPQSIETFQSMLVGRTLERIDRRGKYLLCEFGDVVMVIHLGMTGQLYYSAGEVVDKTYVRFLFRFDSGEYLVFADIRTFGGVYALRKAELGRITGLATLGAEPLTDAFTAEYLIARLAKRKSAVKAFLLDQRQVCGLGNIYVDEALFDAGILPIRRADSITIEEATRLTYSINRVIAAGIEDGGTTFRDYRNGEGGMGNHQNHLLVYGRKGEACRVCGAKIERCVIGGRGTHYCPHCQK